MGKLPPIRIDKNVNEAPHAVILGAGASRASFPQGDKYGRKLPLMTDFVETVGIGEFLSEHGVEHPDRNFEEIYDRLYRQTDRRQILQQLETLVYEYFAQMMIPDKPTLYDELILCLRAKDIIASFNWDPLLIQAYRRNSHIKGLPKIVFLHGNVGVGACDNDKVKGYADRRCSKCDKPFTKSPLLFPIRDKNYKERPFIANEWLELEAHLKYAFIVTIFGYSAPSADINAKSLMKLAWDKNEWRELSEMELIDIKGRNELSENWKEFITREHYGTFTEPRKSLIFLYPRRSCDAFAWAILQSDPWYDKPLPRFSSLHELQEWVQPLVLEELRYEERDEPIAKF